MLGGKLDLDYTCTIISIFILDRVVQCTSVLIMKVMQESKHIFLDLGSFHEEVSM